MSPDQKLDNKESNSRRRKIYWKKKTATDSFGPTKRKSLSLLSSSLIPSLTFGLQERDTHLCDEDEETKRVQEVERR